MQIALSQGGGHRVLPGTVTNRQRIERYDELIELAQKRVEQARGLQARRASLNLILRLQQRALRELGRPH
jgi:ribosomal protein S2